MQKKNEKYGKIFFIKTNPSKEEKFGVLYEINSNYDLLTSIAVTSKKAIGLTCNEEVLEWNNINGLKPKKQDFAFLLSKPVYGFYKLKFSKILVNSNLCLGLDTSGNVLVWGTHKDGLLGLGYNVGSVENPTRLESLKNITEIAMSENHAVVIDQTGEAYSWGSGKYGELGLERSIYSPFPAKINSERIYSKVNCSELLTCFIDRNGKFSYFGVIIKIFKGSNSSITVKSLLKDESNSDPYNLFRERSVYELESENFTNISIGNGFLGLLSEKGLVYTLDHSDNITILYSKYFVYSISVSNNQLYGLSKDNNIVKFPKMKEETSSNVISNVKLKKSFSDTNFLKKVNYYLCRWIASFSERDVISDSWSTHLYKISDAEAENFLLIDSKNKDVLLLTQNDFIRGNESKLNCTTNNVLSPREDRIRNKFDYKIDQIENNINRFYEEQSWDNLTYNENMVDGGFNFKKGRSERADFMFLIGTFDDSYNMKYKRTKSFLGARLMPNNGVVNKKKIFHNNSSIIKKNEIDENANDKINKDLDSYISNNELFNFKSQLEDNNNNTIIINSEQIRQNNTNFFNTTQNSFDTYEIGDNSIQKSPRKRNSMLLKSVIGIKDINIDFINEDSNLRVYNLNKNSSDKYNMLSPDSEKNVKFYSDSAGFSKLKKNKRLLQKNNTIDSTFCNNSLLNQNILEENENENLPLSNRKNNKDTITNSLLENEASNMSPGGFKSRPPLELKSNLKVESLFPEDEFSTINKTENSTGNQNASKLKSIDKFQERIFYNADNQVSNFNTVTTEAKKIPTAKSSLNSTSQIDYASNPPSEPNTSRNLTKLTGKLTPDKINSNNNTDLCFSENDNNNSKNINRISTDSQLSYKRKKTLLTERQSSQGKSNVNSLLHTSPEHPSVEKVANQNVFQHNFDLCIDKYSDVPNTLNGPQSQYVKTLIKLEKSNKDLTYTFTEDDGKRNSITKIIPTNTDKQTTEIIPLNESTDAPAIPDSSRKNSSYILSYFGNIDEVRKNFELYKLNNSDLNAQRKDFKKFSKFKFDVCFIDMLINKILIKKSFEKLKLFDTPEYEDEINYEILDLSSINNFKELQYFSKIFLKVLSIFYKENKNKINIDVFDQLFYFSIENRKTFLLKKLIMRLKTKKIEKGYERWKKNSFIAKSVELLHSIYLKHLNYFFFFFKHYTKVFYLKKKYFEVFIGGVDKKLNEKIKHKFFYLLQRRRNFHKNYTTICLHVRNIVKIIDLNMKRKGFKMIKISDISKKLLMKNFDFFSDIFKSKLSDLKRKFMKGLVIKVAQLELLRGLIKKKHIFRIFFLKKSFRTLKKFSLRENENLYINLKLKKILKIFFNKQRMNLLKMLFKWNNNATKRSKPKMDNYNQNFKLNDFKTNKFKFGKIASLSSFFSVGGRNEKFARNICLHINKKMSGIKFHFLQKIYTNYINRKLELLCQGILKFSIRKLFLQILEKFNIHPIITYRKDLKSIFYESIDTRSEYYKQIDNYSFPGESSIELYFVRDKKIEAPDSCGIRTSERERSENTKDNIIKEIFNSNNSMSSISIEQNAVESKIKRDVIICDQNSETNKVITEIPKIELKNINLPLSSNFNNMYITPKFKNYHHDENNNTNSNNNSSANSNFKEANMTSMAKIEVNHRSINLATFEQNLSPQTSTELKVFTVGDQLIQTSSNLSPRNQNADDLKNIPQPENEEEFQIMKRIGSRKNIKRGNQKNEQPLSNIFQVFKRYKNEKNDDLSNDYDSYYTANNFFSNPSTNINNLFSVRSDGLPNNQINNEVEPNANSVLKTISRSKSMNKFDIQLNSKNKNSSAAYVNYSRNKSPLQKEVNPYYNEINLISLKNCLVNVLFNRKSPCGYELFLFMKRKTFHAKNKEKVYGVKILFRMIKRRIYFYKIRFLHRILNIYSYYKEKFDIKVKPSSGMNQQHS